MPFIPQEMVPVALQESQHKLLFCSPEPHSKVRVFEDIQQLLQSSFEALAREPSQERRLCLTLG